LVLRYWVLGSASFRALVLAERWRLLHLGLCNDFFTFRHGSGLTFDKNMALVESRGRETSLRFCRLPPTTSQAAIAPLLSIMQLWATLPTSAAVPLLYIPLCCAADRADAVRVCSFRAASEARQPDIT
jgi:hypothetical protein